MTKHNGYKDYEFSRRKATLNYFESAVEQFLFEANKLIPISEHFDKLKPDDKRRYLDAVTYLDDWSDEMHRLAQQYDDDDELEMPSITGI